MDVSVTPNASLVGSVSGAPRQIDVLVDARWGDGHPTAHRVRCQAARPETDSSGCGRFRRVHVGRAGGERRARLHERLDGGRKEAGGRDDQTQADDSGGGG